MTGFLLLLAMGAVAAYAMPAADGWQLKFWTGFLAVFLAPFSWPWLIARGHRARKVAKAERADLARRVAAELNQLNVQWWRDYYERAREARDSDAMKLALDTIEAMGLPAGRCGRCSQLLGANTFHLCNLNSRQASQWT